MVNSVDRHVLSGMQPCHVALFWLSIRFSSRPYLVLVILSDLVLKFVVYFVKEKIVIDVVHLPFLHCSIVVQVRHECGCGPDDYGI